MLQLRKTLVALYLLIIFLDLISLSIISTILSQNAFYTLAHQATFTSIPWTAAFVGLPGNFWFQPLAAFLILLHIYAGNTVSIFNIIIVEKNNFQKTLFGFLLFSAIRVNFFKLKNYL